MRVLVKRSFARLTYANVMATAAVFFALGGGAWAVATAQRNSVVSKSIRDGEVRNRDLDDGAVSAAKLKTPAQFTSLGLPDAFGGCGAVGNTWANLSPDVNQRVSYYRDPAGIVHLRGVAVKCNAALNQGLVLPSGFRPEKSQIYGPLFSFGNGRLNIDANGVVSPFPPSAAGSWVSLDGISFRCDPSGANGCP